jgi:hypothetical protein
MFLTKMHKVKFFLKSGCVIEITCENFTWKEDGSGHVVSYRFEKATKRYAIDIASIDAIIVD